MHSVVLRRDGLLHKRLVENMAPYLNRVICFNQYVTRGGWRKVGREKGKKGRGRREEGGEKSEEEKKEAREEGGKARRKGEREEEGKKRDGM